jgi:hypothetical protein
MAHFVFLISGHLRKCSTIARSGNEDGVIAKSVPPCRLCCDVPLDRSFSDCLGTVHPPNENHRSKTRSTLFWCTCANTVELSKDFGDIGSRIARLACVSRRSHPRRTVERINLQSGVIGKCRLTGCFTDG